MLHAKLIGSISAMAMLSAPAALAQDIDWKAQLGEHSGKTLRVMTITDPFILSLIHI